MSTRKPSSISKRLERTYPGIRARAEQLSTAIADATLWLTRDESDLDGDRARWAFSRSRSLFRIKDEAIEALERDLPGPLPYHQRELLGFIDRCARGRTSEVFRFSRPITSRALRALRQKGLVSFDDQSGRYRVTGAGMDLIGQK